MDDDEPLVDMSKLSGIRMKLEEKRRHIEQEKRRLEMQFSKQQQKVGKAAFLQAINKVSGGAPVRLFEVAGISHKHPHTLTTT